MDSPAKKKKKKKKKEIEKERDTCSEEEEEQPSTSSTSTTSYKRGLTSNSSLPDSKKVRQEYRIEITGIINRSVEMGQVFIDPTLHYITKQT